LKKHATNGKKQIHFHSTLHSPEKSNHKTIYKHKKKQPKMRTAMTLNRNTTQKLLTAKPSVETGTKEPLNSMKQKPRREKPEQESLEMEVEIQKG
jgi:competence CoiA-like predicted nuclease